ncbi:MAG: YraN family protein [Burkholderiales bacterium]|nr:YraN family protein [Burkholderiales bacterium]
MATTATSAGAEAEHAAADFLKQQGLVLLEQNFRSRYGEIDLILRQGKTLVFVEVRLRSNPNFGSAAESITYAKQRKLVRTAQFFLAERGMNQQACSCRFDAVLFGGAGISWIQNAFDARV